jgi:hypothetical protein
MEFFSKWWHLQNIETKKRVKVMLENKQLSIINGGWVMNDEASCYYEDIIDQYTLGHQFLKKEFDFIPTVGW